MKYTKIESPCGPVTVVVGDLGLQEVSFGDLEIRSGWEREDDLQAAVQLTEYFSGVRKRFDVELDPVGTVFQRSVWDALLRIPYGETTTYGALAKGLGRPTASRAVGAANGRNPIAVIVPCHRVIGANGSLTGYAGGLDRKRALLALERGGSLF